MKVDVQPFSYTSTILISIIFELAKQKPWKKKFTLNEILLGCVNNSFDETREFGDKCERKISVRSIVQGKLGCSDLVKMPNVCILSCFQWLGLSSTQPAYRETDPTDSAERTSKMSRKQFDVP